MERFEERELRNRMELGLKVALTTHLKSQISILNSRISQNSNLKSQI